MLKTGIHRPKSWYTRTSTIFEKKSRAESPEDRQNVKSGSTRSVDPVYMIGQLNPVKSSSEAEKNEID